jgi:hypothetical protein
MNPFCDILPPHTKCGDSFQLLIIGARLGSTICFRAMFGLTFWDLLCRLNSEPCDTTIFDVFT